jgi:hypothetical protein
MAKLTGMFTTKLWSSGDFEGTVDINFPPQETFGDASIAILVFFDDGWSITQGYMGVRSYRVRPTATGAEHEVHLSDPPYFHDKHVSSVTFVVGTWDPCQVVGTAHLYFWG